MSRVSVIIPTRNRESYLREAIESVLDQGGAVAEIIVVDDGSTDRTVEIARSYQRVKVLAQDHRGGSAARRHGLRECAGDLIIFLDDDDRLMAGAVDKHLRGFDECPNAGFVYGSNRLIDAAGRVIGLNEQRKRRIGQQDVLMGTVPGHSQCMFSREAIMSAGSFNPTVKQGQDFELFIRMTRSRPGYCHGGYVADYRLHAGQVTKRPARGLSEMLRSMEINKVESGPLCEDAKRHWKFYYGQFIPSEVAKCLLRGEFGRALAATWIYVRHLPHTASGTAQFLSERLGGKPRWSSHAHSPKRS